MSKHACVCIYIYISVCVCVHASLCVHVFMFRYYVCVSVCVLACILLVVHITDHFHIDHSHKRGVTLVRSEYCPMPTGTSVSGCRSTEASAWSFHWTNINF